MGRILPFGDVWKKVDPRRFDSSVVSSSASNRFVWQRSPPRRNSMRNSSISSGFTETAGETSQDNCLKRRVGNATFSPVCRYRPSTIT